MLSRAGWSTPNIFYWFPIIRLRKLRICAAITMKHFLWSSLRKIFTWHRANTGRRHEKNYRNSKIVIFLPHFPVTFNTVVTLLTTTPTLLYEEEHLVFWLGVLLYVKKILPVSAGFSIIKVMAWEGRWYEKRVFYNSKSNGIFSDFINSCILFLSENIFLFVVNWLIYNCSPYSFFIIIV